MIALLITDVPFEQDIRELFMAFYPGEGYIYEDRPEAVIRFTAELAGAGDAPDADDDPGADDVPGADHVSVTAPESDPENAEGL